MFNRLHTTIGSAPLATALAVISLAITLLVAVSTVADKHVPSDGPLGLISALVIAAVATTEASLPAQRNRSRRRMAAIAPHAEEPGGR